MSLDLANKTGCTSAGTFAAGLTAFPTDAQFAQSMADNAEAKVYIDTSAGDVTLTPAVLADVVEGDRLMFVKATADANKIIYTDADGVTYNFVNRQSEYICLKFDGTNWSVA